MKGHRFWLAPLAAAATFAVFLPIPGRTQGGNTDRPNVLIIVTDDQRGTGTLQVLPKTRAWFKRGGTQFNHAFVTTPLCCPSRASIMTGQYVHNHDVEAHTRSEALQLDHGTTLQAHLKQAGYTTGIFGKYLNRWPITRDPPFFDRWSVYTRGNPYYGGRYNVQGRVREIDRYWSKYMGANVSKFLRANEDDDEEPWFLYLAPPAPHGPAVPLPRYRHTRVGKWHGNRAVFEKDRTDKPLFVQSQRKDLRDGRRVRRNQLRALLSVDDVVARVSNLLDDLEERDTIAFFVSDNGEMWAEHGITGKTWPYFFSVDVPLLVRWPGRIGDGVVDERLVANIDIAPTIYDATDIQPVHTVDGRSLLGPGERERLLLEYEATPDFDTPSWAALWRPSEQYIEYYDPGGTVSFREYYNLDRDPWQLSNLLGDINPLNDPNVLQLSNELDQDRSCAGSSCP